MHARLLITMFFAAALVAPAAMADWSGKGSYEPSTPNDRNDGWMFQDPDTAVAGNRVYFNGYITDGSVVITPESPNFASLKTGFATTSPQPVAILGVWKDCNADGYIGNIDNVGFEYRTELLLGANTICPPGERGTRTHNDGEWVREFWPIVWGNKTFIETNGNRNPIALWDNSVRVWADQGRPTDPVGLPCHLYPQPAGTFSSTGGLVAWADCQTEYGVTAALNSAEEASGLPIGFGDVEPGDNGNSQNPLNQRFPVGESSDRGYVEAWDCSRPPVADSPEVTLRDPAPGTTPRKVTNPTNGAVLVQVFNDTTGERHVLWSEPIYAPGVPTVHTDGSLLGTLNRTETGAYRQCNDPRGVAESGQTPLTTSSTNPDGRYSPFFPQKGTRADEFDCLENSANYVVYFIQPAYVCEVPYPTVFTGRIRPDIEFFAGDVGNRTTFYRQTPPGQQTTTSPATDTVNFTTEEYHPTAGRHSSNLQYSLGAITAQVWRTFDKVSFQYGVNRHLEPAPANYLGFYAYVAPTAQSTYSLILPKGTATGSYGLEACAANIGSYNCDRDKWWKDADGNDIPQPNVRDFQTGSDPDAPYWQMGETRTFLEDPYNMRDVDCFDNMIGPLRDNGLTPQQLIGEGCS